MQRQERNFSSLLDTSCVQLQTELEATRWEQGTILWILMKMNF